MKRSTLYLLSIVCSFFFLFTAGCNTAVTMGDRTVGVKSGKFFYTDGTLKTDYTASFEKTWRATEKALHNMNATIMETEKKISSGTWRAHMESEDVKITVEYLEPEITTVAVRVGLTGNNLASRLIHDRIRDALVHLQ
ncbi:MAG TPA: DUF3568 family protein [Deltaproteobacteria bacterium]|nr:DUF3568 family protein [Deltaproteobacteria bacterium]